MKKKLLLISAFVFILTANAQTVLYSDNFNTEPTNLSYLNADGDTQTWMFMPGDTDSGQMGIDGGAMVSFSIDPGDGSPLYPNNFFLTPNITIPTTPGITILEFKFGTINPPNEHFSVYLVPSTVTAPEDIAVLSPVFSTTLTNANEMIVTTQQIDVSSFAGQTVKIAIRHHDCSYQSLLFIDDLSLFLDVVASASDFISSQFSVYPNPINNSVTISNTGNIEINKIVVCDINGRTVKTVNTNAVLETTVNVSELNTGVYFLNIETNEGSLTKKIVKN
ncbi:T9SS-dependent choice-of-anchor J family protein [Flavobacterium terrigena]|uniref:Por secretion system C-terminal sorting domain-containing protein n=2 Tax=Flavobacterium terrigena TaxID=402734 RepID=A0A1H6Q8P9_9FLAO|nr:T9SS type A sorting domain-containing protein [Flavobacterium terrigena]SEI40138.1 Por secretion system C-terminal sorting domain-containing protein [Flavobacterium terrigena]